MVKHQNGWRKEELNWLILKDENKGNKTSNFRPITCIRIMWKVFPSFTFSSYHTEREKLLPDDQKGCRTQSRGTKNQLMTDEMVMKNLSVDMFTHTWILQCLKIFKVCDWKVSEIARNVIEKWMKNWKVK